MAKVTYSPGIEFVQGSLAKPKKQDGHNHGDYLIGTHRVAPTTNPNCTRMYIRKGDTYDQCNRQLSQKETATRAMFASVAAAVAVRRKSLEHIASDKAAFDAQKDLPEGKKTMRAYLWAVCKAEYESAQG
jgi:hypothetical protein